MSENCDGPMSTLLPEAGQTSAPIGDRRIGAISAFFLLCGTLSLFSTLTQVFGPVTPGVNWSPHTSWRDLLYSVLFTTGCFGTSHAIGQRSRGGILVTGMWFIAPLCGLLTGDPPGLRALCFAIAAIATLASLWRDLR